MESTELEVALLVTRALESLGLRCLIGGSLASSLHGVPRSSHDVDLLADVTPTSIDALVRELQAAFYVDGDMIRDALRHRTSFNLIHYDSGLKVDIFPLTSDPLLQEEMNRRQPFDLGVADSVVYFATAEDMVLQKLAWYRAGGESSERQWTDVLGMLKVQGAGFDSAYARRWAVQLGVADLLQRAESEADDQSA